MDLATKIRIQILILIIIKGQEQIKDTLQILAKNISGNSRIVQVPGPKKWLILGVSLTHLVESRDLFFLEVEIVGNIFQWDVLKNMWWIKSYDDMFQAIRALTIQKILKIRILSQHSCKMKVIPHFLSDALS